MEVLGPETRLSKTMLQRYQAVIVGSGLFGSTVAEHIARVLGGRVLILERRGHVGGNVHSQEWAGTGIPIHTYGPHIFHTSNAAVWNYISRFADFNNYRHHVWAKTPSGTFPLPVSLPTLNQVWGEDLSPDEAKQRLAAVSVRFDSPRNFEEKAKSLLGEELYGLFFAGYTRKQWGLDPSELPASVFSRLPVRFNRNTSYFTDKWEGIPTDGYSALVHRMLKDDKIHVLLQTDWSSVSALVRDDCPVIFTGAIDEFFGFKHGQLGWRTIDFEFRVEPTSDYQGCTQMNYPDESVPFTREVEYKHFHPENRGIQKTEETVVSREYSRRAGLGDDVYYPVNTTGDRWLLEKYRTEAKTQRNVAFGGRLGSYQYLDMHMAIASAITLFSNYLNPELGKLS